MRNFVDLRNDIRLGLQLGKRSLLDLGGTILGDVVDGAEEAQEAMATATGFFDQLEVAVMSKGMTQERFASNLDMVKATLTKRLKAIKNEKLQAMTMNVLDATFRFLETLAKGAGKAIGIPGL